VTEIANSVHGKFKVFCQAGDVGLLSALSDSLSIVVSQNIRRGETNEMWESLQINCHETEDGSLSVQVVVFHPDWDDPVCIASLRSRRETNTSSSLIFDLDQRQL
jgi:hypothetical protein